MTKTNRLLPGALLLLAVLPGRAQEPSAALGALMRSTPAGSTPDAPSMGPAQPVQPVMRAAPKDPGVDLSGQFPTGSRDQQDVGSCHVFTSIGLLEAAYFRRTGEHVQLSEADLFLQYKLLNGGVYYGDLVNRSFVGSGKPEFNEGGNPKGDIEFAVEHGVATTPQYAAFVDRYRRYREAMQRTMQDIERQRRNDPWYVRLLYNPRRHWAQLEKDPVNQRITQNYLLGNDRTIEDQRAQTRDKLKGLKVSREWFVTWPSSVKKPQDQCRQDGRARTDAVLRELKAGRPVGVSFFTDDNWGSHVLIIQGYAVDDSGGIVFKTRNSWGAGGDFDMFPHDMCKVHGVIGVR